MTRKELITSPEYSIGGIQNDLFRIIEHYLKEKGLNKKQFADQLGVTKSDVTQILNGDFDHKISKLVELCLSCNVKPVVFFVDMGQYVKDDEEENVYVLTKMNRYDYYKLNDPPSRLTIPFESSPVDAGEKNDKK